MRKPLLWMLAMILLVSTVMAAPPFLQTQESLGGLQIAIPKGEYAELNRAGDVYFHIFNSTNAPLTNETTDCMIHVYNDTGSHVVEDELSYRGNYDFEYEINDTVFNSLGIYTFIVWCNSTNDERGFISTNFEVTGNGNEPQLPSYLIAIIILLPLILSIISLIGAATLGEEHNALRIFLFLFSMIPFFGSMHMGLVSLIEFYDFPALQEVMASTTYWVGIIFGVIITYFIIYLFYTLVKTARAKRIERLNY